MISQIYATKKAMSQTFKEGKRVPLTKLKVNPHIAIGRRTQEKDGYSSVILSIGQRKRSKNKAIQGQLKSQGLKIIPQLIKEVRSTEKFPLGQEINLEEVLTKDSVIQATGTSKGKGFTGVIKRWGFSAQNRTHGQSDRRRAPGSIGRGTTPGRVLPGKKMAGRHGNQAIVVKNLKIVSFDPQTSILEISGSIPGAFNSLIKITIIKPSSLVKKPVKKPVKKTKKKIKTKPKEKEAKTQESKNKEK